MNKESEIEIETKGLQLTTQPSIELSTVITESGLEVSRAQGITNKYLPFLEKIAAIEAQTKKIDFENPTELDEKICRELRLQLVPNRTGCDKFKKAQKAEFALINGLNDNCYGIVEKTSKLLENKLEAVEKAGAIKEAARVEALKTSRLELIKPYLENADIYPLGSMSESAFDDLLNGSKLAAEQKATAAKKAEDDRLAKELEEKAATEKLRLENERLKKEAEEKAAIQAEADKQALITKELVDRKNKELAEQLEAEKKAAEVAKSKAESEAKSAADKMAAEKDELEKKLKAAEDAMEARKKEAAVKEQNNRLAAEKLKQEADEAAAKAKLAPDKEKLREWVNRIMIGVSPDVGADAHKAALNIHLKFSNFKKWANDQIDAL